MSGYSGQNNGGYSGGRGGYSNAGYSGGTQSNSYGYGSSSGYNGSGYGASNGYNNAGGYGSSYNNNAGYGGSSSAAGGRGGYSGSSGGRGGYGGASSNTYGSGYGSSSGYGGAASSNYGSSSGYTGGYGASSSGYGSSYGYGSSAPSRGPMGSQLRPVDFNKAALKSVEKNVYVEHEVVKRRNQNEIVQWMSTQQATVEGRDVPRPVFEFNECGFSPKIERLLYASYQKPTVIQSISWPVAMSGRDMISIARTGSGKTLGFILPGIMHILRQEKRSPGDGPIVLVLLPTRELAQQVEEVAREYCAAMGLSVTCLFGGASKGPQAGALQRGVDVCIATPGRLLDFLEARTTNMLRCSYLVLDEADRMLDMGFEPQIRKIVSQIRPDRQTLMFSATWPKEIRQLASDFQKDAVFLNVGSMELSANHNIQQNVEVIDEYSKQPRLLQLLDHIMKQKENKTIIFTETKRKADHLTQNMRRDGWPALCIHGDKSQAERDWVMSEFKQGKTPILLATNVAARGLDVSDIAYVINYDFPSNSEDYVHRIGRTGRSDRSGVSYTFFTQENGPKARDLIKVLQEAKQVIPDALQRLAVTGGSAYGSNAYNRGRQPFKRDASTFSGSYAGQYKQRYGTTGPSNYDW